MQHQGLKSCLTTSGLDLDILLVVQYKSIKSVILTVGVSVSVIEYLHVYLFRQDSHQT